MSLLLEGARMQDEGKDLYEKIDRSDVSFNIRSRRISPDLIGQIGRDWATKIMIMIDKNHTLEMILNSGMMSRCRAECILTELINAGLIETKH